VQRGVTTTDPPYRLAPCRVVAGDW
jgi:hypothetical protein